MARTEAEATPLAPRRPRPTPQSSAPPKQLAPKAAHPPKQLTPKAVNTPKRRPEPLLAKPPRATPLAHQYAAPSAAPGPCRYEGDQLRVELHHWCGAQSTPDAQGAVAICAIHLQQLLEGEARIHREEQHAESDLFRSYFANDATGIM